jgi:hypothetical protein
MLFILATYRRDFGEHGRKKSVSVLSMSTERAHCCKNILLFDTFTEKKAFV